MARVNISLPDQLVNHAKGAGLNISQLAARAITDELNRLSKRAEFQAYLDELEVELGPMTPEEEAEGEEWASRVLGPMPTKNESKRRSA
jgi:hypothetical protein